jgi:cbb3-type cytochrome oxidase maturation protein
MNIIILLIGVSLVMAIGFLTAFIWSVKNGQLDDQTTPAMRMLWDDAVKPVERSIETADNEEIGKESD